MASEKTAKAEVAAVFVSCPNCTKGLEDMSGSLMITGDSGFMAGQIITCIGCGEDYRMPAVIGRL
jgi:hypothetical protein